MDDRNYKDEVNLCRNINDYTEAVASFKKEFALHAIIGFSGGSDDKIEGVSEDDELQRHYKKFRRGFEERIINEALGVLRGHRVAILTGGTVWGVPNAATKAAKAAGFKTIGVFPQCGRKYAMTEELLDLKICVNPLVGESAWGDECPVWVSLVDGVIVIGGGAGTLTECAHIQKINESRVKYEHTPKFIVPIHGTGGVAEVLPHIWTKPEIRQASMPAERVHEGKAAARLLIDRLHLYDCYDPTYQIT